MQSMTGYGTGYVEIEGAKVAVEARTVNHRFFDPHIRLPREYQSLENDIQQVIRASIRRGRVDMNVSVSAVKSPDLSLNLAMAREYVHAAERLREDLRLPDAIDLKTLLALPGVLQAENAAPGTAGPPEELRAAVIRCVNEAVRGVAEMRRREGSALENEMLRFLDGIGEKVLSVRSLAPGILQEYRDRLQERVTQLAGQVPVDPQRLAQETAIMAERSDFTEELARLESHLDHFRGLLDGQEAGKKMDFLLQEMQREANTVLSKCANLDVARLGIAIKADIEKLREQCQNVE